MPTILLLIFVLILLSGCAEEQSGKKTICYVDSQGLNDYTSIQQAIDHCSEDTTIVVYTGTYTENLFINKTLNIQTTDRNNTIIQPKNDNQNSIICLNADNITIAGFTIQATPSTIGIHVDGSYATLSNNIIQNTKTAVNVKKNKYYTTIYNNTFINNQQGIYTDYSHHNTISNNIFFLDETSSYLLSYGIYIHNSKNNILSNNNITNYNQAMRIKGSEDSLIFNNSFHKNKVGVYCCCGASQTIIYNNNFIQNELHAKDDVFNQWDNGTIGNYWDDYQIQIPEGKPTNGIYDKPYLIYRWINQEYSYPKQDRYPLVNPVK